MRTRGTEAEAKWRRLVSEQVEDQGKGERPVRTAIREEVSFISLDNRALEDWSDRAGGPGLPVSPGAKEWRMAINVFLQDIKGAKEDQVYDLYNSLIKLWPINDSRFPLLQYIDPYGNVIFNGSQMCEVLAELNTLMTMASTNEQRDVIHGIINLATRCQRNPHTYLRFSGD